MRHIASAILVLVLLCGSARADYESSGAWFDGLSDDQRYELQVDLMLLGYYDAFADGVFGRATYRAITEYQSSLSLPASGKLSAPQLLRLSQQADRVYGAWGLEAEEDEASQATMLLPTKILTVRKLSDRGSTYSAPDYRFVLETLNIPAVEQGFTSLYNELSASLQDRTVTYHVLKSDRFVVAGRDHETLFYTLFLNDSDVSIGFTLRWTAAQSRDGAIMASYLASHFVPTRWLANSEPSSTEEPPPRTATAPDKTPEFPPPTSTGAEPLPGQFVGSFYLPAALPDTLLLTAEISLSTPLEFLRALKARPNAKVLALNSPGGLVDAALVLAHEVKERGLATLIIEGNGCYSACAFIYFAGTERMVMGELGVHQLWSESNDLVSGQAKLSDVIEALDDFGAPRQVLSLMLRTPPEEMHVFSSAEIVELELNSGDPVAKLGIAPELEDFGPERVAGWGSPPEAAESPTGGSHTKTVSFVTTSTKTVANVLDGHGVSPSSVAAIAAVFRSAFNVAVVPKGVRVMIHIGSSPKGGGEVPHRVDLSDLPQTYYNGSGKASVVLTPAGTYAQGAPL